MQDINDDLRHEAEGKWHERLLKKSSIEAALVDYNVQVDDAARSFQVLTSCSHCLVGGPRLTQPNSFTDRNVNPHPTFRERSQCEISEEDRPTPAEIFRRVIDLIQSSAALQPRIHQTGFFSLKGLLT